MISHPNLVGWLVGFILAGWMAHTIAIPITIALLIGKAR
jgi:hypothetical protein